MRILQVVHAFLPAHSAGTEIYTWRLSRELAKRHDVRILAGQDADLAPGHLDITHDTYDGLPVTRIHHGLPATFRETYDYPACDDIFRRELERHKPDIIHVQHVFGLSAGFLRVAKSRRIPTVLTCADYWFICPPFLLLRPGMELCDGPQGGDNCATCGFAYGNWFPPGRGRGAALFSKAVHNYHRVKGRLPKVAKDAISAVREYVAAGDDAQSNPSKRLAMMERLHFQLDVLRLTDRIIAPSHFLREQYIAAGVSPDSILASDYGFDTSLIPERAKKIPGSPLQLGFLGTLVEHKGAHIAIEAMRGIENAHLRVYGDPNHFRAYARDLNKRARGLNVSFPGPFDNNDVGKILADLDAVIVPSLWYENSPLVIHEAFLAGVPVLASNSGGMAELVRDGEGGYLFERHNPAALRALIERLVADPALLTRLPSQRGAVKTIEQNAAELEELYAELTASRP